MLFTYKYISQHDVYKLQEYLDFLFKEVWLKAEGEFDVSKLDGFQELKQIYIDLGNIDYDSANETKNKRGKFAYFFNSSIVKIYNEFAKLDEESRSELDKLYDNNNNIEGLCNDKTIEPITYKEIETQYPDLAKALKSFYDKIYGNSSPFNLEVFGFLNKKMLLNHYKEFATENTKGVCPFCGIYQIESQFSEHREAYDHFLPKSNYPFVSLNFKNLAPMCHKCNSTYKKTKVLIKDDAGNRTLAFYPYSNEQPNIEFEIELKKKDILSLTPNDIEIEIKQDDKQEQVESWKRVFDIEKRYKNLICNENVGIAWYQSIIDEFENIKEMYRIIDLDKFYDIELKDIEKRPLANYGFLKKEFLKECKRKGLINAYA